MKQPSVQNRITVDPEILGGKPAITGTRVPVSLVLNLLAHGYSFERIVEAYPYISEDDIRAALSFAELRVDLEAESKLAS